MVRIAATLAPVTVAVLVAWTLTRLTPTPASVAVAIVRWLVIAVVSSTTLLFVERFGRRLIPIAGLLDLSLVFPDRAPSRFRIALRTGTTYQLQRRIEEARAGRRSETPAAAAQRVLELVAALRIHDHITRGHSERVRAYTQMIADEMNLPVDERDRLRWAGLLHDVGKLLVPTSVLNKKGKLTADEFELIKTHPENGRRVIEALVPWLGESARAVWEHHERWDGGGYPAGLAGEQISLAARIVAVADSYDVMTSARSYKAPVSPREARIELTRCAGTQFDPAVVRAFLNVSIGRVRRSAGPLAWLAQLPLFPAGLLSANSAGGAVMITGALSVGAAGATPGMYEAMSALDPRPIVGEMRAGLFGSDPARAIDAPVYVALGHFAGDEGGVALPPPTSNPAETGQLAPIGSPPPADPSGNATSLQTNDRATPSTIVATSTSLPGDAGDLSVTFADSAPALTVSTAVPVVTASPVVTVPSAVTTSTAPGAVPDTTVTPTQTTLAPVDPPPVESTIATTTAPADVRPDATAPGQVRQPDPAANANANAKSADPGPPPTSAP
jgi:hypothetical protein